MQCEMNYAVRNRVGKSVHVSCVVCTAIGNLGHPLNQDCDIITISLERSLRWRTKRKRRRFTAEFKAEIVLEALRCETSQAELCHRHNLSEDQFSKWKPQLIENAETSLFASTDKQPSEAVERIAHLKQLVTI